MEIYILALLGTSGSFWAIIVAAVFFMFMGSMARAQNEKAKASTKSKSERTTSEKPEPVTANAIQSLSRSDIQQRLGKLLKAPVPEKLQFGAKCYEMAAPPERAEYVCPKCGEKTLYTKSEAEIVEWKIPDTRRNFKELQGMPSKGFSLDESQFCRKCSPNVKTPKIVLKVEYAGGNTHTVEGVTSEDFKLLKEFLSGKVIHDARQEGEKPLKDYSKRLQELLGVEQP